MPSLPPRTALLVLAGPHDATDRIAELLLDVPGTVVVGHDRAGPGRVHRRVRDGVHDTLTAVVAGAGPAALLRDEVLPVLLRLAGTATRVVLQLEPDAEPEQVCWALAHAAVEPAGTVADVLDLRGVVTAVDSHRWLADATGARTLPDGHRTVAQVVGGQVEFADLLVLVGTPGPDPDRLDAVLARLAPTAARTALAQVAADPTRLLLDDLPPGSRRGRPDDVHGPLLRGRPSLDRDRDVVLHAFAARRPFHPRRLHDAIDVLLDGVVRTRGRLWLATRPDDVLWLESAGGAARLAHAGTWLAGADADAWAADPERAALAAARWHDRFGDRAQDVTVLCAGADPTRVDAALRAALLTDDELAAGETAWAALPDPFAHAS